MLLFCGFLDTQVHKGIEVANLLADTGYAHEFYELQPAPPSAKSVAKRSIRDWVTKSRELYSRN